MGNIRPPKDGELDAFFEEQTKSVCNKLEQNAIAAIERIIKSKGRAEVLLTKDGVVVQRLERKVEYKEPAKK